MSYTIDLSGRVALVTGASSGLGAQFARTLANAGAGVVLAARRIERLKTLRAEIEADGGDAHVVELDVTDIDSIRAAVAHAETEMGTIDILVNNSGVSTTQKLVDVAPEDYDFVMDTNTRGAFFVAQEVGKRMIARSRGAAPGAFVGGRIVNVASVAGLRVLSQIGVYAMSKAAVVRREAARDPAAQARRPAAGPGRGADDAVREREPPRQRRGHHRRRRLRGLTGTRRSRCVR